MLPSVVRAALVTAVSAVSAVSANAQRVIEVRPGQAPSIAEAVRMARPGDRIAIGRGVYREPTIVVDRRLTIVGEPGAVLDGGAATHIMRVEADSVTVRGLELRNVTVSHVEDRAAIRVGEVSGCRIEDNRVTNAFFGIYLAGSTGCVVARNELRGEGRTEDGTGNAIHLWTTRDVEIVGNRISGHRDGIYLEFAHGSRVAGNVSERNVRYGLHFMSSEDCRYERNVFRRNEAGVAVMYTKRVSIVDNRFEDNPGTSAYGLLLKEVYDAELLRNVFARNTTALFADGATRLDARGNLFSDNGWAVKLMASTLDASFTGNVFLRNSFDVAANSRTGSNRLQGNYWDEYRGYDIDRDGRGDVAHRPVRLFSLIVERNEPTMVLLRSPLVALLDRAERVVPSLTPETLSDPAPLMRRPR
ncbi:MAG TPA: nitrous oxide reductase family maturation protein NosD [Gemmatimonadaceae bacterium]|nr:nitrous oxide reductase family maturation protein NosD [Gemmatimonadaceae bacterium]